MPNLPLFSVRMRASAGGAHEDGGRHLSGAERLANADELEHVALELLGRGRAMSPDHLRLAIDRIDIDAITTTPCLDVTTVDAPDTASARAFATRVLHQASVTPRAVNAAYSLLEHGARGDAMPSSGAVLLDLVTGNRIETRSHSGVRASRFDYAAGIRTQVRDALEAAGLGHFRTFEALALATKVIWSGVTAELCWSDDPGYVAGYVATPLDGYVRFPGFKPEGAVGGRVFFVAGTFEVCMLTERLTRIPLIINTVPKVRWVQEL